MKPPSLRRGMDFLRGRRRPKQEETPADTRSLEIKVNNSEMQFNNSELTTDQLVVSDIATDYMKIPKIASNLLELIGRTPLLELGPKTAKANGVVAKIFLKLESMEPCSSVKDRIARSMVLEAERRGEIFPGRTLLVEPTSGNTGIGLAMVGAAKGYEVTLVMPASMTIERRVMLKALGAKLVLTPPERGMKCAVQKADEILARMGPNGFKLNQFDNLDNMKCHRETTGPEIWQQTSGTIDILVGGIGTGGTISGVSQYIKALKPSLHTVAVEPAESAVLSGGSPGAHKIQGIGTGFIPGNFLREVVDEVVPIDSDSAVSTAKKLAVEEGVFVGISSGAALAAAMKVGARPENAGKNIVVILPSFGERYLSSVMFKELQEEAIYQPIEYMDGEVPPEPDPIPIGAGISVNRLSANADANSKVPLIYRIPEPSNAPSVPTTPVTDRQETRASLKADKLFRDPDLDDEPVEDPYFLGQMRSKAMSDRALLTGSLGSVVMPSQRQHHTTDYDANGMVCPPPPGHLMLRTQRSMNSLMIARDVADKPPPRAPPRAGSGKGAEYLVGKTVVDEWTNQTLDKLSVQGTKEEEEDIANVLLDIDANAATMHPMAVRILRYWFRQTMSECMKLWFGKDEETDAFIDREFKPTLLSGRRGELNGWITHPLECLALVILLDQFPRNVFRFKPEMYSCDAMAQSVVMRAMFYGYHKQVRQIEACFFCLVLTHAENIVMQELCVEMWETVTKAVQDDDPIKKFDDIFRKHVDVIARFGRFPHRNGILQRVTTPEEGEFLEDVSFRFDLPLSSEGFSRDEKFKEREKGDERFDWNYGL